MRPFEPSGPNEHAGEPVFSEPWQAQAFAMTLALQQRGLFTWSSWSAALSAQLKRAGAAPDGRDYYDHWLAALETMLIESGTMTAGEIEDLAAAWRRAFRATPHGKPVALENDPGA